MIDGSTTETKPIPGWVQQLIDKCFITPTNGRVVIAEDEFRYGGKIYIPDNAKKRPTTGRIVAISPGDADLYGNVLGKRVVYGQFSGTLIEFKGFAAYRILNHEEILGEVLKEDVELTDTNA